MERDDHRDAVNRIDGPVTGPTVQAGSIQGGVHFHLSAVEAVSKSNNTEADSLSASDWARLPELPSEIWSLMHAQIQAAQELPYRLPGARRPSLATVYVRQDLGSGTEAPQPEQRMPTPIVDDRGQTLDLPNAPGVRSAVRPPARTMREVLDESRHLVITGGPGQGKSTLSLRLAADIANRWQAPGDPDVPLADTVVPLRLTARELAARMHLPFAQAIAESASAEYGALLRVPLDTSVLSGRVVGCPWLLLVDGLDEVADGVERDRLVAVLSAWASRAPEGPYRVVLTTRPIEGAALAPLQRIGATRYELQPFDDEAMRRFAENWFAEAGADSVERFLWEVREAHLDELVRVPLLATIAAIVLEQHGNQPLPDNQYELYEAYLSFLGSARATSSRPFDQHRAALLEHLGRVRLETDTSLAAAASDWAQQNLPMRDLTIGWQEELITFVASTGPLVIRGDDLSFLHHSFAEHLAATAIARTLPERLDPDHHDFANLLHTAQPKETGRHARAVLLHYGRLRLTEADPLLQWLHAGTSDQHLLAARLLARHLPAGNQVVDAFLVTVRGWAMATQYAGDEILRQACRATHHQGLVSWLLALMRDVDAPWRSRIEAGSGLAARLRNAHIAEATALLRAVVDDAAIPINHRLTAAEALAQCGASERGAAERGLRAVLRDPLASGASCRSAAVVLSAFGTQARKDAVEALTRLVSDPDTPTDDLVEATTGLIEIGVEFHQRCADVLRAVLDDPVDSMVGRRDAALAMASLGPQYLADAATALTKLIGDRRYDRYRRGTAAGVLGELGPQHRLNAGQQLIAILAEPMIRPFERSMCASLLGKLGPEFRDHAVSQLRSVIADTETFVNNVMLASRYLADIGPEYWAEAAEMMWKVYEDPLAREWERVQTLGQLVSIGAEPHRNRALDLLRAIVADCAAEPLERCRAAEQLIGTGPEFHAETGKHLHALAESQLDPDVAAKAWQQLLNLGTAFQDQAYPTLISLVQVETFDGDVPFDAVTALASSNIDQIEATSTVLLAILNDESRSVRSRITAGRGLIRLGRKYHRQSALGVREVFRSMTAEHPNFEFLVRNFTDAGIGIRAELGKALRDLMSDARSPSALKWQAIRSLNTLGVECGADDVATLQAIVDDESLKFDIREDVIVGLATRAPENLPAAAQKLLALHTRHWLHWWRIAVLELASLGAKVSPQLRDMLANNDQHVITRSAAAALLVALQDRSADRATADLQRFAQDDNLEFRLRSECWWNLVELDRMTLPRAAEYYQSILEDESEKIDHRTAAARYLAQLDQSRVQQSVEFLHRTAEDPRVPIGDRCTSVEWLGQMRVTYLDEIELDPLALSIAYDPWISPSNQRALATRLPRKLRTELERSALSDRSVPIEERLPQRDYWDDLPLATEAEREVRDTLMAVESRRAERVAAAAALAGLSWRLIPEATRLLEQLARQDCATHKARQRLATLGQQNRQRVQAWAETQVRDEATPFRMRNRAANLIMDLTSDPPSFVTDFLRQVARDERASDRDRIDALFALRLIDGVDGLRAVRDDERQLPAARWRATDKLLDKTAEGRVTGARVLHAIADDTSACPALRWRVARTLARLGVPGRDRAAAVLGRMAADTTLPTTARAAAAQVLGEVMPSCRRDALNMLHSMNPENLLHRHQVLLAISTIDAAAAATQLKPIATDERLSAVARLRCAETLVGLRRDQRETATAAARAVAHDNSVATHIRLHAARNLARWSELCRAEARDLIRTLTPNADRADLITPLDPETSHRGAGRSRPLNR